MQAWQVTVGVKAALNGPDESMWVQWAGNTKMGSYLHQRAEAERRAAEIEKGATI